jgi:hypothetical protein
MQRPVARLALVLLLGTCLWAATGRRERSGEHAVNAVQNDGSSGEVGRVAPPRIAVATRRLPPRVMDRPVAPVDLPIRAHFETSDSTTDGAVHAAGFSAEVTANAPAWLTGTIEVD